jgi:pyruvate dehydrogenase E2 component (dihydrolipoamide acetyltransferase)
MIRQFHLPDVGEGISEAEIVRWLLTEGAAVEEHQDLLEIETDKAVVTLPSPHGGRIARLHRKAGDIVKVGEVLVSVETAEAEPAAPPKDAGSVVGYLSDEAIVDLAPPVLAAPAVRALAKTLGVDLARLRGSGTGGKITKEDVEQAARAKAPPARDTDGLGPIERVPLRGLRRTIAKRMQEARSHVPDVTIWEDADITELDAVRLKAKELAAGRGIKFTYLPFIIKAALAALREHPFLNATLDEATEEIVVKRYYNIGIAVDTADGLIVFAIKQADRKNFFELASEVSALAEKARTRKLELAELKGSTFTITNYGVIGASYGTPIINYPEVGILGIGKIEDRPAVKDGQIMIRKIMPLSLAFDHRVVDGVEAARFLNVVIRHLENPDWIDIGGG